MEPKLKQTRRSEEELAVEAAFVEDMDNYTFLRQEEEAYRKRVVSSQEASVGAEKREGGFSEVS